MGVPLLDELVILFLISIVVNTVCTRLRLPATVGFLITGVLCGPSVLAIVSDKHAIDILAELGIALLLFTIGMELSGEALARLKKPVFLGGSLQIGLSIVITTLIVIFLHGQSLQLGIFSGCIVALSSSAIVLKIMQEKGTTATPQGKLTLAILVFQDIMVAPMMLSVPLLSGAISLTPMGMLTSVGQSVLALGAVFLFARYGLNPLMAAVVRTRARELLLLTTLGLCMGLALLTESLGMSLSLGAFLAGLFLARSEYSMSVVSGVLPYRDVFMSLFFISVGMLLDVSYLVGHIGSILANTTLFILVKTLIILPAILIQKYPLRTAIIVALTLAQVGEFSFVLADSGLELGFLTREEYQTLLAMSILTMMLTPALIHFAPTIANILTGQHKKNLNQKGTTETEGTGSQLQDHCIIIGFGISGQHLARVAKSCSIPYEILEMNPDTVTRFHKTEPIHYGDASQPAVLEHLGIKKAKVLAIVISDPTAVQATVAEAVALNPHIRIVARTRFLSQVTSLQNLGACDVIAEEFESSMEVFSRVLYQYMIPKQDIDAFITTVRQENYTMLRSTDNSTGDMSAIINQMPDLSTQVLRLEEGATLCGQNLIQSALRRNHAVTIVAVKRGDELIASPNGDFILQHDDIVYLFGKTQDLNTVAKFFTEAKA